MQVIIEVLIDLRVLVGCGLLFFPQRGKLFSLFAVFWFKVVPLTFPFSLGFLLYSQISLSEKKEKEKAVERFVLCFLDRRSILCECLKEGKKERLALKWNQN